MGTLRAEKRARQRWNGESRHRISVQAEDLQEVERKWEGDGLGVQQEARHRLESRVRNTHGSTAGSQLGSVCTRSSEGQAGKEQRCLSRVETQGD